MLAATDADSVQRTLRLHATGVAVAVTVGVVVLCSLRVASSSLVVATGVLCLTATVSTMKLGILQGLDQMRHYSLAVFASTAIYAVFTASLVAVDRISVPWCVAAAAAGNAAIAIWPAPGRDVGADLGDPIGYATSLKFGFPTAAGAVAALLLYRLDLIVVSGSGGAPSAGLYAIALAVTELIWIAPTAAAQALVPHAAKASPTIDTARLCRSLMVLMIASAAGVADRRADGRTVGFR